mmetsp:Transcript_38377/g.39815  ORF Transcript_38377/g.39815 Transcript_38377/m.39815 type:complete len:305 (-) Transcript_38377:34-948(-)
MKWIVDTDYSSNSQKAIEILIKSKLDIVAITLVHGFEKQHPVDIKKKISADLEKYKVTIPVYLGATEPYIDYVEELGDDKLLNPYHIDSEVTSIYKTVDSENYQANVDEIAATKIIELINTHGKNLNILTLSALTNISLAALLDNSIVDKFNQVVTVGGSVKGKGNSGVVSEANFRADPVAAKNLILYYKNVFLLSLEYEEEFAKECLADGYKFNSSLEEYAKALEENKKSYMHLLAAAFALNNSVCKSKSQYPADVDITGKYTRGAVALERYEWVVSGKFNTIQFLENIDIPELVKTLNAISL